MAQRMVIWTLPYTFYSAPWGEVVAIDLEPSALRKTYPELAGALAGGRVISHGWATSVNGGPTATFIVES